jgi:hypothetical protein
MQCGECPQATCYPFDYLVYTYHFPMTVSCKHSLVQTLVYPILVVLSIKTQ